MEAPVCNFRLETSEDGKAFIYRYEEEAYLTLRFDAPGTIRYTKGSDSDLQVEPPLRQMLFEAERDCEVTITFRPVDGIVLRPQRAQEGQAILSQSGKPLIYGANGVYDLDSDLYIVWHGIAWKFQGNRVLHENGRDFIKLRGKVRHDTPLVLLVFPQYYRKHLSYEYHNPRTRRFDDAPICGWATWEAFHRDISIENLQSSAAFISEKLKDYGLEYIQVDDGYQSETMPPKGMDSLYDGWLNLNEKFPNGHESIVTAIRDVGLEPALWLNAMVNNEEYADKSGKFLRKKDGQLIKEPWIHYTFDCTEESCEEISRLYRRLTEYGYKYFKVDAIRHLIYDGLQAAVRQGILTNEESVDRFRNYMGAIRRGIGEDSYLLSCWGMLTPNVGICDAMRFATDASASEESFRMQVDESARWHHTHGILYRNDADYICLRMEDAPAASLSTLTSLNGYLYMISDHISLYNEEKLDIARKTIPPVGASTAETGAPCFSLPMNYYENILAPRDGETPLSFGNLWATHYSREGRNWAVVTLVRTREEDPPKTIELSLAALGLDPDMQYAVFDFWKQSPLGFVRGKFMAEIPAYLGCTVLSFTPMSESLELVGSSRHVSMDAVSVTDIARQGNSLTLTLDGVENESFDYWFAVAEGADISCADDYAALTWEGRFLKCRVTFREKRQILTLVEKR